jgi:hypothetical protein
MGESVSTSFCRKSCYHQACKNANEIAQSFGSILPEKTQLRSAKNLKISALPSRKVAARIVDISQSIQSLSDILEYSDVRVFVTAKKELLGSIDIPSIYQTISTSRLVEEIVKQLGFKLLNLTAKQSKNLHWSEAVATLTKRYTLVEKETESPERLPSHISVTINLATYDRPDDLRNCLRYLVAQETSRLVEIIVVDNHPASGLTPPVVAEFPGVKLISEPRQGLAYAGNAGFVASTGNIVIAIVRVMLLTILLLGYRMETGEDYGAL